MRYMIIVAFLFIGVKVFAQNNFPIPTPQPISSPTAYPTPSTVATSTANYPLTDMDNSLATVQAELEKPIDLEPPSQVIFLANAFGFIQYIGFHDRELFGVFSPIFIFLLFLTPISITLLVAYVGNLLMTTLYSIVSDIYQKIRG